MRIYEKKNGNFRSVKAADCQRSLFLKTAPKYS